MKLNPLLDSVNGYRSINSKSALTSADSDGREFLHNSKLENPLISFAVVERSQYQGVWNDSDYTEFSDPRNSNTFRCLKKRELPKNAKVATENGSEVGKQMTGET